MLKQENNVNWLTCIHNNAGHRSGVPHDTPSEEEVTPVHTSTPTTGLLTTMCVHIGLHTVCVYTEEAVITIVPHLKSQSIQCSTHCELCAQTDCCRIQHNVPHPFIAQSQCCHLRNTLLMGTSSFAHSATSPCLPT